jgi:hypothetical protein
MHRIWSVKEGHGLVLVPDIYLSIHLEVATKRTEMFLYVTLPVFVTEGRLLLLFWF